MKRCIDTIAEWNETPPAYVIKMTIMLLALVYLHFKVTPEFIYNQF